MQKIFSFLILLNFQQIILINSENKRSDNALIVLTYSYPVIPQ